MVLNYLPGAQVNFRNANFAKDTKMVNTYPSKFFNALEVNGMPSHKLPLKIGAPVILLHYLDPLDGLCNGTRLIVRCFTMRVVEARSSHAKGSIMWPLSHALNSFSITTICHLHLQGNNFFCEWLML